LRVKRTTLVAKLRKRRQGLFHAPLSPGHARGAAKAAAFYATGSHEGAESAGMTDRAEPAARLGFKRS